MEEIWKDVVDYEGMYQVSNLGRVKSLSRLRKSFNDSVCKVQERILKFKIDRYGYKVSTLTKNSKLKSITIHRLVAKVFLPNPNNYPQINHINGNKLDNTVSNLEWCDNSHNMKECYRLGLIKPKKSKDNVLSKKVAKIKDGEIIKIYDCIVDASKDNNLGKTAICNCLNGRSKTSSGYNWIYIK